MEKKNVFTKILAVAGAVLVWLPILAPFIFAVGALITRHRFLFDFLMPAELFLVALVGWGLLFWAALRARARRKLLGWSFGLAVAMLLGSQALAVVTGLASGEIEANGWQFVLVLAIFALYCLLLIVTGVGGILLLRDLFKPVQPAGEQ